MSMVEQIMNTEQQMNLKVLVQLGKTLSQMLEMLQQVDGYNTMSYTHTHIHICLSGT